MGRVERIVISARADLFSIAPHHVGRDRRCFFLAFHQRGQLGSSNNFEILDLICLFFQGREAEWIPTDQLFAIQLGDTILFVDFFLDNGLLLIPVNRIYVRFFIPSPGHSGLES